MRRWLDQKFQQSIRERFPRVLSGTVTQRQLFVLPSLNGISWVLLALVIWLTGINYQNGLVLLIAYLMASIWLAGMWLCYRNLLGITFVLRAFAMPKKAVRRRLKLSLIATGLGLILPCVVQPVSGATPMCLVSKQDVFGCSSSCLFAASISFPHFV